MGVRAVRRQGSWPMENLALIGLSRQISLHRELEVVANNIANLDTTGYKADGSVFHEFLMPVARAGHFEGNDQRLSYVHDRATWHNFSIGPTPADRQPARRLDRRRRLPGGADAARRALYPQRLVAAQRHRRAGDRRPATACSATAGRSSSSRPTATSRSIRTAPSPCAKPATPRPIRRAASCGWCASTQPQTLLKDGGEHASARRTASRRSRPTPACASCRARSSSPTCVRWSRWRA